MFHPTDAEVERLAQKYFREIQEITARTSLTARKPTIVIDEEIVSEENLNTLSQQVFT